MKITIIYNSNWIAKILYFNFYKMKRKKQQKKDLFFLTLYNMIACNIIGVDIIIVFAKHTVLWGQLKE